MTDDNRDQDRTQDSARDIRPHDATHSASGAPVTGSTGPGLPQEIGGYRIIGLLGEGGMGVVYEAEQPSPRRLVALKVVRGVEMVDELRLKMFQREAETLARLDHPNIGAIYASGRTEEGRHFFAMELVRGQTLAGWLAGRPSRPDRAEIELRLQLFRQICEAVHYAHQRGVIHRDLKPSNLIVTDAPASSSGSGVNLFPMVKILDFGLARITEEDVAMTQVTEIGVIKGTLPYMAPEQATGKVDAIDVRTDVYALGVILYELMTGQRPYSTDTGSLLSAVHVICEQTPQPMDAVWKASLRLDPDLVTLTNKALEKDPEQRFASAAAFGEDVGRFLTSQPILARPTSTMYQLKKLVSRRKALFATAAASLVLLIVAAVGIGILYVQSEVNLTRALEAEEAAVLEATTAKRTSSFLVDLFRRANPENTRGETVTAREVMDEGARRVREDLDGEPIMQARLMKTIGDVYESLGLLGDARNMADQALALRREHLPPGDIETAASLSQRANLLQLMGEIPAAKAAFDSAVSMYAALGEEGRDGLVVSLANQSWMLGRFGEFDKATAGIDRALAMVESQDPVDQERLISLLNNQATIKWNMGKPDVALPILKRSLQLARQIHGDASHETANVLTNLSGVYGAMGLFEEAEAPTREALAIRKAIYGDSHPDIAKGLGNLGVMLAQQGKFEEAKPILEESLRELRKIHGPEHPEIAQGLTNLGLMKVQSGDARGAVPDLKRSATMHEQLTGPETPSLSFALYHLASAHGELGEFAESRRLLLRVVAIDEKLFGPESEEVAGDLEGLAQVARLMNRTDEAEQYEVRMNAILAKLQ